MAPSTISVPLAPTLLAAVALPAPKVSVPMLAVIRPPVKSRLEVAVPLAVWAPIELSPMFKVVPVLFGPVSDKAPPGRIFNKCLC